ncbi:hypothetical protein LZL87_014228 [Fusarium oxysporum]|nr:hypothetical protein LZL87_014228 [Fusarium oxysporum]
MRSFELRILVLHPRLDDFNDEIKILQSNLKVLKPLPEKFELPWICEIRYANAEKQLDAMITLRYIPKGDDPEPSKIIETLCDNLFRIGDNISLESIRNGVEVLFKPLVGTENNDVDQAFLRSFIISMGKSLAGDLAFKTPKTLGNNFFTRQPERWFMGPMKAVMTLEECVQGLGRFLELVPPRTISSTNRHATAFIDRPPSESVEIYDEAQKVEIVLRIMRGGGVIAKVLEEVFWRSCIFLTIALWRRNGLLDDDERLLKFAERMAKEFNINNLPTNWNNKDYATGFITTNRALIVEDMHNMMKAVRKRRNIPNENQATEDDSAHQASPDHNVQQGTVVEVNGQNLLQTSISSAGGESALGEVDSSSAISETEDSTSDLPGHLGQFYIPEPPESSGWGSVDGADSESSGLYTPTELSNNWGG